VTALEVLVKKGGNEACEIYMEWVELLRRDANRHGITEGKRIYAQTPLM
jgi:hypothetical protein